MEPVNPNVGYTCGTLAEEDGYGEVCIDLSVVEVSIADGCVSLKFHKDLSKDVVDCISTVFDLE